MAYIVQELQKSAEGSIGFVPPVVREDQFEAESDYYIKCGYAAVSTVWQHTVLLYTDTGERLRAKCYKHAVTGTEEITDFDPEDTPEPEEEINGV